LIRWNSPILGEISPDEFIIVAEESGLIKEIGAWVIDRVCNQIRHYKLEGVDVQRVNICRRTESECM